jgi:dolichol-phosphate mannosyltransferase
MSSGMADFRLLDRQVVEQLLQLKEGGLFLRGLVQWVGYQNTKVPFQCRERYAGQSKYNFRKMLKFAWTGITSFSIIPLRLGILLGLITSLFAFYQLIEALYVKFFTDQALPGWASIFGVMTLLFGIMFILMGVLGEYIGRILIEVRGRPKFIISEEVGIEKKFQRID